MTISYLPKIFGNREVGLTDWTKENREISALIINFVIFFLKKSLYLPIHKLLESENYFEYG